MNPRNRSRRIVDLVRLSICSRFLSPTDHEFCHNKQRNKEVPKGFTTEVLFADPSPSHLCQRGNKNKTRERGFRSWTREKQERKREEKKSTSEHDD
jgi:hypothetical protein